MIIGLLWFKKTYKTIDYIVVFLLIIGLYIFIAVDSKNSPQGTTLGIIYVILSMFFGASIPMIQEHCMNIYHASVEELLYYSFIGSTIMSFILSLVAGELWEGVYFFYNSGNIHIWLIFGMFTSG